MIQSLLLIKWGYFKMLKSLKFVQGAVAKKDYVPSLTHFRIENGFIKGFNGELGLCSPIDLDLTVSPKATTFIKAIQTCKTTVAMHITPTGRLAIKSGNFKAFIDCDSNDIYPDIDPEGEIIKLDNGFLPIIKKIAPFIADDASRPWARGILFRGQSAFVTNNIIIVEYWLGYDFPVEINIPHNAIKELLRIGEEPTHLQLNENQLTFHYSDGRWLKTQICKTQWPDLTPLFEVDQNTETINEDFWESIESIIPFIDDMGRVYMEDHKLTTTDSDNEGVTLEVSNTFPVQMCFNAKQVFMLKKLTSEIDFSHYPKPCPFVGENLRGVIVGIRI